MGRLEEGMGEWAMGGGHSEWGAAIRKDSVYLKMILTCSCPHGAGQHPGMGEATHPHRQEPGSPQAV